MKINCFLLAAVIFAVITFAANAQSYVPEWKNEKIIVQPTIVVKAFAFNVRDIRLLDSPFKEAMDQDAQYLLSLEPDRFLNRFREHAGLEPKAEIYGGWESEGVSGFSLGHYLSACAMLYASTSDERFRQKVDYIVDELALCQQNRGTGYVGGIPKEDSIFTEIAQGHISSSGFDLNGGWVPWYTIHKLMAGLLDAYLYADNEKAKQVIIRFADWADNLTQHLSEEQMQKMLDCEHGGMNEVLANLYAITANKKYLDLSYRFNHHRILDPLANHEDELEGKHANTQIPKVIGVARQYELTGNEQNKTVPEFFWQTVTKNHTYVIGGNSDYEHFGKPGHLSDRLSDNTTETCNTYNMLKLTRHLFSWNPSADFGDYFERALYNHILASQNPRNGMMCYYVPLRMGSEKAFSTPFDSFWCCVGTGMENHVKYGEQIYARGEDGSLYVNLFIPSTLNWKEKKVMIRQETSFPKSDTVHISIDPATPTAFPVQIRQPHWASQGIQISINGEPITAQVAENGYAIINREWKKGDQMEVVMPMSLYTEAMLDNPDRIAVLYGPMVLAGKLGKHAPDPLVGIPVFITKPEELVASLKPVAHQPMNFRTSETGQSAEVTLAPFYQLYDQHYSVYWDLFTPEEWEKKKEAYATEKKRLDALEAKTVDVLRIGEMQPERDHQLKGENTEVGEFSGRKWRHAVAGGWFSFEMKVAPDTTNTLLCTYWGGDHGQRDFDIYVDEEKIGTQQLMNNNPGQFFDVAYPIPSERTQGRQQVVVKLQAKPGKIAGGLFGCRIIKSF